MVTRTHSLTSYTHGGMLLVMQYTYEGICVRAREQHHNPRDTEE
mgnify:CR=1 FL=1